MDHLELRLGAPKTVKLQGAVLQSEERVRLSAMTARDR